jgi:hypothetical protein
VQRGEANFQSVVATYSSLDTTRSLPILFVFWYVNNIGNKLNYSLANKVIRISFD